MRIAAIGARAAAVLVDGILVFVGFGFLVGLAFGDAGPSGFDLHGGAALTWAVASLGYWFVLEGAFGATVGKRLLGIHVVGRDGARLTWGESFGRNALRVVDGFPYVLPYLVGGLVAVGDSENRRLGDRAAGSTVVYRDRLSPRP